MPNLKKLKNHAEYVHQRVNYESNSKKFLEWAKSIPSQKSFIFRIINSINQEFSLKYIFLVYVYSLVLTTLMFFQIHVPYDLDIGQVVKNDIVSPLDFQMVDEVTTEDKRIKAENASLLFFDLDLTSYERVSLNLIQSFKMMRDFLEDRGYISLRKIKGTDLKEVMDRKPDFEKELGVEIPDYLFDWMIEKKFSHLIEGILLRNLDLWYSKKIVENVDKVLPKNHSQIVVRVVHKSSLGKEVLINAKDLTDVQDINAFQFLNKKGLHLLKQSDITNLLSFARTLISPNLTLNKKETAFRRQTARESVLPVKIEIKKNQVLLSKETVVQPFHMAILNHIELLQSEKNRFWFGVILSFLLTISVFVFISYLRRVNGKAVQIHMKEMFTMMVVSLLVVTMVKIFLFVADEAFVDKFSAWVSPSAFLFASPVAAASMMVGLLLGSAELIWVFSVFFAICMGIMIDFNFIFFMMSLIGGIAAARGVYICRKRNDIYWAGVRTGLVNMIIVALMLIMMNMDQQWNVKEVLSSATAAFLGGILSSVLTQTIVPLMESWFNLTTDVKLLELSNLNHPLLKEMIVKAPGTYHHSIMVGSMVEAAAEEIGANPLLGKVMSYYHDIGKMVHPEYYIENQKQGHNPHDHISPFMSKTLLIAHVKDGVELGMKHKLGKPIIDGILQHHGTTVISFFYNKALDMADAKQKDQEQLENEFRYPGPKPQFREAALCMLADSIEAAARSLDEPTPSRLTSIVHTVIQRKFTDRQLDECGLSLTDLTKVENAFVKILIGIYHQRIDYPRSTSGAPINIQKL